MKKQLKQIDKFCQEHNLTLVPVDFENQSQSFNIHWSDDLTSYLQFVNQSNCTNIFLSKFSVNYKFHKEEVEAVKFMDKHLLENAKRILSQIRKFANQPIRFLAMVSIEGNNIFFGTESERAEEFFQLTDELDKVLEIAKEDFIPEHSLRFLERKRIMEPFAIELANHKDYHRTLASNDEQDALMKKVLGDRPFHTEKYNTSKDEMLEFILIMDIRNLAKVHFKINVEPILEKEFIEKIREWKKTKMPKVEMASKLGIRVDKLNQYYYKT